MSMDKQKVDNYVDELIDVINQKQTEIDELVASNKSLLEIAKHYIKNHDYFAITNSEELIQKHTKK